MEDSSLLGASPPPGRPGQPRWLAPQGQSCRGVGGIAQNLLEPSMTFQKLPGPSGTYRDRFGTFRTLLEHFQDLSGPLKNVSEPSKWVLEQSDQRLICPLNTTYCLSCPPITERVVGTSCDYPETIPVDP